MTDVGVEVGQKMRSAIKAKLTELDCYVDDELPDYIMVMIANKRTKSQMKEDLQLFLSAKTATFVDWLHIVLKKLKEVHVTNPDVFKKPVKRKSNEFEITEEDIKKVKKERKEDAKALKKAKKEAKMGLQKSLTDDLPMTANKLSELRKIVIMKENQAAEIGNIDEDNFDIPLLSEISASNEEELELLEKKIKNVKSRLGLQIESDNEEDCLNIKLDPDDLMLNETKEPLQEPLKINNIRKITVDDDDDEPKTPPRMCSVDKLLELKKSIHTRITFDKEKDSMKAKYEAVFNKSPQAEQKKKSILDRLGKRPNDVQNNGMKRLKVDVEENKTEDARVKIRAKREDGEKNNKKEGILSRLGVMSKVSVPVKRSKTPEIEMDDEEEKKITLKEVPSVVKIKPRVLPPKEKQANPNLLFKAVAEAQRSVSQRAVPAMQTQSKAAEPPALFTKKYKEQMENKFIRKAKLRAEEKNKLKNMLNIMNEANAQNANSNVRNDLQHVAEQSEINQKEDNSEINEDAAFEALTPPITNQKFIVTLDGLDKSKYLNLKDESKREETTVVQLKRTPSPIIFDTVKTLKPVKIIELKQIPPTLKTKERCIYWPTCRQGEKCDFLHPTLPCKMFPNCKFEEKCLYIHPACKFETSCTRRDCPYSHITKTASRLPLSTASVASLAVQKPVSQICKFFPNCTNTHCTFYHPRLCKFGIYCKNQPECNFVHSVPAKTSNLTWRLENKF